jgi:hypothetical protein
VAIAEGAHFRGSVDMQKKAAGPEKAKPAASPQPGAASTPVAAAPVGAGSGQRVGA